VFSMVLALPLLNFGIDPASLVSSLGFLGTVASLILANIWYRNAIEKDRQETLRKAEEKYREIVENSIEGIFQSTRDGKFLSVNPAMVHMYRYPSEDAMLKEIRDISQDLYVSPGQRQEFIRRMEENGTIYGLELEERRRDGSIFWISMNVRSVRDENEKILYYEGTVEDITVRKQFELERENLIVELEKKNTELEQFTYTVSHDLKSPLVTIKGFLGFLAQDALDGNSPRLEDDIHRISESTDRMQHLLNDLLELSRIGRSMNPPEQIDFRELVDGALKLIKGQLGGREINIVVQDEFPRVYGDRQRLLEVLQNLLENSIKFMGDQTDPRIEIGVDEGNEIPVFFIKDNGSGIAPEYHERIFGLFNRLDPNVEGTGIGLAIVKRIIEVHGGRIWVESDAGKGAAFFFTIPHSNS